MPRRPKRFDYKTAAAQLRSYGYAVHYGNGKKGTSSPQYKSAARKAWNKVAPLFITNKKQTFKFFPLDKEERKTVTKSYGVGKKGAAIAKAQLAPRGVFMRVPKGIRPEDYTYTIGSEGEIISEAVGPRGGKRKETVYNLDPVILATDPQEAVESLLRNKPKPFQARMVVNGNEAKIPLDWKAFLEYAPEKISFIMDPNLDPSGEQGRLHGEKGMSEDEFAEIFQVKTIHQTEAPPPKKPKRKKKSKTRHVPKKSKKRKTAKTPRVRRR